MGDRVLDGIRYMEEKVIVETLKLSEGDGQAAFHLGVITVILPQVGFDPMFLIRG